MQKFAVFTEEAEKIYGQFKKHKQLKQLSYNEEQIHKMDKWVISIAMEGLGWWVVVVGGRGRVGVFEDYKKSIH